MGVLHSTRRTAAAVPDLVDAILVLPTITRQLEVVAFQTATLMEMHEELIQVRSNTAALPSLDSQLGRVHQVLCQVDLNTQSVHQLADVLLPLHGAAARVGRLADRLPQRREGRTKKEGRESEPDSENGIVPAPSEETAASAWRDARTDLR
jgi:hypothetical protein